MTPPDNDLQARAIYDKLIIDHCDPKHWIKYAKFEIRNYDFDRARRWALLTTVVADHADAATAVVPYSEPTTATAASDSLLPIYQHIRASH